MRDRDREVEIISLLADDLAQTPAPDAEPRHPEQRTTTEPTRRRWWPVGAVAGLSFATIAAAVYSDDRAAEPVAVTTTSVRAQLAPDSVAGAAETIRFVLDGGLRPYSADIVTPPSARTAYRLWSDPTASDRWISLQISRGEPGAEAYIAATRRVVDGIELVSPSGGETAGISTAAFAFGNGWSAVVRAAGINDNDLASAAQRLPRNDRGGPGEPALVGEMGFTLVASTTGDEQWLYGDVTTTMKALTADGTLVTLRAADGTLDDRRTALPYFANDIVCGADGSVGGTLINTGEGVSVWEQDGQVLSLTADLTVREVVALRSFVRRADDDEWRALLNGRFADYRLGDWETAATGTTADGASWLAGAQLAERDGRTLYLWWWSMPNDPTISTSMAAHYDPTAGPGADTVAVRGATYVFVTAPVGSATTAAVTAGDGSTVEVPLRQLFADAPTMIGAVRVEVEGAISVTFDR